STCSPASRLPIRPSWNRWRRSIEMAVWLLVSLVLFGQPDKNAPPLTKEQYDKVRDLVRRTQEETGSLQAELEKRQRELVHQYNEYELNLAAVEKLHSEISDLQRKLMANYHRMQVELRTLVGKERFLILNQRLNQVIGSPLSKPVSKEKLP